MVRAAFLVFPLARRRHLPGQNQGHTVARRRHDPTWHRGPHWSLGDGGVGGSDRSSRVRMCTLSALAVHTYLLRGVASIVGSLWGSRPILMNEATDSVDRPRERRFLAHVAGLQPRPTLLIISHRPDTLCDFDRVITLSDGRMMPQ